MNLKIKKVDHRGRHFGNEDENTIPAFERAVNDQTCYGAECDVRFSGDEPRELVVVHDKNLGRTRGRHDVVVAETTADDLYTTYRVPRLSSVLEVFRDSGKTLLIDYKMSLDGVRDDTLQAVRAAEDMAIDAGVTIVHLVWRSDLPLNRGGLEYPVYFVRDVNNDDPNWAELKEKGYKGVSLKYTSGDSDFVETVKNLVANDLSVNVYTTDVDNPQAFRNSLLDPLRRLNFQGTLVLTVNDPPRHVVHDPDAAQPQPPYVRLRL